MTPALDISQYQGAWQDRGDPIVMIKAGGGDDGLYFDPDCAADYSGATADGRAPGLYWFAGWTNPSAEASFFLKAVSPLAENDVYALDAESIPAGIDPVAWCLEFNTYIHNATGAWPLIYMNLNTLNSYNWNPVLANSGLWLADWAVSPDANIPTPDVYVMQQYFNGPSYDHDEWFGTVAEFQKYGYHAPAPTTEPTPPPVLPNLTNNVPNPTISTTSSTGSTTQTITFVPPTPPTQTTANTNTTTGGVTPSTSKNSTVILNTSRASWWTRLLNFLKDIKWP